MKIKHLSLSKAKQIIHAYVPLLFIILFPKSFLGIFFAVGYILITGYVYLDRSLKNYSSETYEYYNVNLLLTLILIALHINVL